jgi:hypothetical protein
MCLPMILKHIISSKIYSITQRIDFRSLNDQQCLEIRRLIGSNFLANESFDLKNIFVNESGLNCTYGGIMAETKYE